MGSLALLVLLLLVLVEEDDRRQRTYERVDHVRALRMEL